MRKAIGWEKNFFGNRTYLQFALKLSDSKYVKPIVEKSIKAIVGFHVATENGMIYPTDDPTPVFKLPDDFKSLNDACNYMYSHHTRPFNKALASIGTNSDTVVLNISHAASDARYFSHLLEILKSNDDFAAPRMIESVDSAFSKEIDSYKSELSVFNAVNPKLSRIYQKETKYTTMDNTSHLTTAVSDCQNIKCYNQKTKLLHHFSENLWSSVILSASAFSGNLSKIGVGTYIDLRQFIKNPGLQHCNIISSVLVSADVTKDTTLGELMMRLRSCFDEKMKNKEAFGYLKAMQVNGTKHASTMPGIGIDLSSIGPLKIGGPIKDVCFGLLQKGDRSQATCSYINYTVTDGMNSRLVGRIRHSPFSLSDRDAELYVRSVHYALENFTPDIKCGRALDELIEFQSQIQKSFPKQIS